MNDLTGKYFAKKTKNGEYQDLTTLFDGLRILKIDGFMSEGQPKNVYTASWEYDDDEDFAIVMQDDEDAIRIIRECSDLEITFIIKGSYASETIDVNTQHLRFKNYMLSKDVWIKSMYQDELEAHCVCLKEYKPTTEKYHRGIDSYVMGTITMHMLEKPTNTKMRPIVFEDPEVKRLCVENWGGGFIEDEITEYEAAQVTSLNNVFYNNDTITKFNELRYFTSLTSLYRSGTGDNVTGQFHSCALLEEITIPKAPISDFRGAFRACGTLEEIDLSPTTATQFRIDSLVQGTTSGTFPMKKVKLPKGAVTHSPLRAFWRAKNLTTIEIDGYLDFSEATSFGNFAVSANSLTTITGIITGIAASIDFSYCPLTYDSAMVVIEGLAQVSTSKTVTFKTTTYATLSEDDIAVATDKGWNVASASH